VTSPTSYTQIFVLPPSPDKATSFNISYRYENVAVAGQIDSAGFREAHRHRHPAGLPPLVVEVLTPVPESARRAPRPCRLTKALALSEGPELSWNGCYRHVLRPLDFFGFGVEV
jgi:hypothetical protein